jgi:hypothetical protein
MGFVNQKIETPDQLQRYEALHLTSPVNHEPVSPSMWTVDETRDWRLVDLGGGALEVPFLFAFAVPGGILEIESQRKATGKVNAGTAKVDWNVSAVRIPRALASQAPQLTAALTEALTVYGYSYISLPPGHVRVTLPSPEFF